MGNADEALASLKRNRALESEAEAREVLEAIATLRDSRVPRTLAGLFGGLHDDTNQPQLTFQVVHLLESFPFAQFGRALLEELPSLEARSPWWAQVMIARALNSDVTRSEIKRMIQERPRPGREAVCRILQALAVDESHELAAHASNALMLCDGSGDEPSGTVG